MTKIAVGRVVDYAYDEALRLVGLKDGDTSVAYGYDESGRLVDKRFDNGMETAYRYGAAGLLSELIHSDGAGILDRYAYVYDAAGNKVEIEKQRRGLETESGSYGYTYDPLNRLTGVNKDGEALRSYAYDPFGNRTVKVELGKETRYAYNAMNQMLTMTDGENDREYRYDQRGNLTELLENGAHAKRFSFDALNRLTEVENLADGKTASYRYNGMGQRIGEQVTVQDPALAVQPTKQIDYILDLTQQYNNLLQTKTDGESKTYAWDGSLVLADGNACLLDELGSPVRYVGNDGSLTESYGYDEFGNPLYEANAAQPFGYTGYRYDEISGNYFAQAREYDPLAGRFVSQDANPGYQEFPITLNRYTYCFNMPMIYVDKSGQWPSIADIGQEIADIWDNVSTSVVEFAKSDTGKIVGGILLIAGATAITIATAGVGAGVMVGAASLTAGIYSGVSNEISDAGSFANGFLGGSINGIVSSTVSLAGFPVIGNSLGGSFGNAATAWLNNLDSPGEKTEMKDIVVQSLIKGGTQGFFAGALGGIFDPKLIGNANSIADLAAKGILAANKQLYSMFGSLIPDLLVNGIDQSESQHICQFAE